jgi:two-component sensor histidine kinase
LNKTATANPDPATAAWPITRRIGVRLLLLLLIAESPLVGYTVFLALQNSRLQATDAVSVAAAIQGETLARFDGALRAAAAVATAADALPPALLANRPECDGVLDALARADVRRLASVTIVDPSGATVCATAGALPHAWPPLAAGQIVLRGAAGRVFVLSGGKSRSAVVALGPAAAQVAGERPSLLWLRQAGAFLPANGATAASLPRAGDGIVTFGQHRLATADGRQFLYQARPLPSGYGDVGDVLLAGTDIRAAGRAAARTAWMRACEIAAFFLAEFLLVAGGVSLAASQPLRRLNDAVDRWRRDRTSGFTADPSAPAEVTALAQSFAQATDALTQRERELETAIAQQELLMQEIHHRVKNNLQIIASLLNLQSSRIRGADARAEFQSARDRVRALATLHRHLYAHGELHMIDMRAFFAELCGQLFQSLGQTEGERISLDIVAPDITISSDQAVPIALMVTEIVGNAVKYAFPDGRRGQIHVGFVLADDAHATLTVRDDGVGFAERTGSPAEGLGLQLIRGFARQLGAKLTISTDSGTCYRLDMEIVRNRTNTIALGRAAKVAGAV